MLVTKIETVKTEVPYHRVCSMSLNPVTWVDFAATLCHFLDNVSNVSKIPCTVGALSLKSFVRNEHYFHPSKQHLYPNKKVKTDDSQLYTVDVNCVDLLILMD